MLPGESCYGRQTEGPITPKLQVAAAALIVLLSSGDARAQRPQILLDRGGSTIVLEPYAPNIVRVTLSLQKEPATAAPGYGFVASPAAEGWSQQQDAEGDVYRSQLSPVPFEDS